MSSTDIQLVMQVHSWIDHLTSMLLIRRNCLFFKSERSVFLACHIHTRRRCCFTVAMGRQSVGLSGSGAAGFVLLPVVAALPVPLSAWLSDLMPQPLSYLRSGGIRGDGSGRLAHNAAWRIRRLAWFRRKRCRCGANRRIACLTAPVWRGRVKTRVWCIGYSYCLCLICCFFMRVVGNIDNHPDFFFFRRVSLFQFGGVFGGGLRVVERLLVPLDGFFATPPFAADYPAAAFCGLGDRAAVSRPVGFTHAPPPPSGRPPTSASAMLFGGRLRSRLSRAARRI